MENKTWGLVDSFFDKYDIVDHHIKSYNDFVENRIQNIIDITEPITIENEKGNYTLKTGKIKIEKPFTKEADGSKSMIYPTEARLRNLNYSAHMYLQMALVDNDKDEEPKLDEDSYVYIGELPLMLKSSICHLHGLTDKELMEKGEDPKDPGGYFIVNGSERAVVTMEEIAPNKIILLVILLRALGLSTDQDIIGKISDDFNFQMYIADDIQVSDKDLKFDTDLMMSMTKEEREEYQRMAAIKYIGNRVAKGMTEEYRIKRAEDVIDRYLLPHMGIESDKRYDKAIYLAEMTEMLLQVIEGQREPHDKDHYTNKRLRVSGDLMEDLFRVAFSSLTRDMSYQLERSLSRGKELSIKQAVRSDVLTENIKHAIATGNWVGGRAGVSQLLDRVSYMATLSHLRRVVSPLTRSQPHFEARDLHPTQFGKICPNETPEGPNCGLVKNLALMCKISEGFDGEEIVNIIRDMDVDMID